MMDLQEFRCLGNGQNFHKIFSKRKGHPKVA